MDIILNRQALLHELAPHTLCISYTLYMYHFLFPDLYGLPLKPSGRSASNFMSSAVFQYLK